MSAPGTPAGTGDGTGEGTGGAAGIGTVAVVGTGVIGVGWTALFLSRGLHVRAFEIPPRVPRTGCASTSPRSARSPATTARSRSAT
ncbi:3-hydroxyacyl-CoA dehydrogenase NAD-binding domain-containing protein [Pseudonocardia sp. HH130629-09]|uniref:3-hydroxyacyl-CoA dehydrogenase NAD-binding domain-containing protein n=1 Tax=Pseudonocardia sp. HH130629-09 TaxID=1641402 RepID=UPI000AB0308A|nr:3-hydroxyacyl-CoA dehydrogenase NAD-binding domain-containing protein [Pseudonocardia sp. HH130629-09]